ncbi:MAG: outer membrane beta-barrel protein [Acidobacteriota bacterium]|nr:MAG: outer membrane beta-barrel protein [Acidobacteriota bacterium]
MTTRRSPVSGRLALGGLVCVAIVAAFPCALAQSPTRDNPFPRFYEPRRWGPFFVEPEFTIDNIGYDDNIFLRPEVLGQTESDIVIQMGPRIRAQLPVGQRMALTFEDKLSGELFLHHPDLNHADNSLDAQYDILVGRVLLTTRGGWTTSRQRPNSEIDERTRREAREAAQTVRLFVGPRTDLVLTFGSSRIRYTDADRIVLIDPDGDGTPESIEEGDTIGVPIGVALDRDEDELRVQAGWRLSGGMRLFVEYRDTQIDFVSELAGRDVDDTRKLVGLELSPNAYLTGELSFGQADVRNTFPGFEYIPYDGSVGRAELTYRPTGSTRLIGRYERDVNFSTYERNLYYRETERTLSAESFLGQRWGWQAGWSRRELQYPEENTIIELTGSDQRRRDEIDNAYAGVLFRYGRNVVLGIRYGVRQRDSNVPFFVDEQKYISTVGSVTF